MTDFPLVAVLRPAGGKRRRRPPLACEQCRRRKVRCDRLSPCTNCSRSKNAECSYAPLPPPARTAKRNGTASDSDFAASKINFRDDESVPRSGISGSSEPSSLNSGTHPTPATSHSPGVASTTNHANTVVGLVGSVDGSGTALTGSDGTISDANMQTMVGVKQLEWKPEDGTGQPQPYCSQRTRVEQAEVGSAPAPLRGIFDKARYFGPSHWMNFRRFPNFMVNFELFQRRQPAKTTTLLATISECKTLGRAIKCCRLPISSPFEIGLKFPHKLIADNLLNLYLRNMEPIHRILHVPSFQSEYDQYWTSPESASQVFVIQLQLCMAIGSAMHDETFSMRSWAARWVHEAQIWLVLPPEKARMSVSGIQAMCLLQIARQVAGVGGDLTWISVGTLLRYAMHVGLHRDPRHLPNMTVRRAEMHRRLWATILELAVQSSIDAGGHPLISLDDFDTEPPLDVDDEELTEAPEPAVRREAVGEGSISKTSLQLLLLKSLPIRLKVANFVNHFRSSHSFEETLRLNSDLTSACHYTSRELSKLLNLATSSTPALPPFTDFHRRFVELMTYRYIMTLHFPILVTSFHDPTVYFSRKASVDTALRIASLGLPFSSPPSSSTKRPSQEITEFVHLSTSASGSFAVPFWAAILLCALELLTQKKDEVRSFGNAAPSRGQTSDLKVVVEQGIRWTEDRVRAGDTNVKGNLFLSALDAHVVGLQEGLSGEERDDEIARRMGESIDGQLGILKGLAQECGAVQQGVAVGTVDAGSVFGSGSADVWASGFNMEDWEWQDMEWVAM